MGKITRSQRTGCLKPQHHCGGAWKQQDMVTKSTQTQRGGKLMVDVIIKSKKVEKWFKPFTVLLLFWFAVKRFHSAILFLYSVASTYHLSLPFEQLPGNIIFLLLCIHCIIRSYLFWSLCETVPDKGKPWFMYEAYQHIIKVQVEYLIRIGVDPALKVKIPFFTQNAFLSTYLPEKCLHYHSFSLKSLLAGLIPGLYLIFCVKTLCMSSLAVKNLTTSSDSLGLNIDALWKGAIMQLIITITKLSNLIGYQLP